MQTEKNNYAFMKKLGDFLCHAIMLATAFECGVKYDQVYRELHAPPCGDIRVHRPYTGPHLYLAPRHESDTFIEDTASHTKTVFINGHTATFQPIEPKK